MAKIVLIFVFLLTLTCYVSGGNYEDVTHYQYVTDWTPTYCRYPAAGDVCQSGLPDIFVMHGIWPANSGGHPVTTCSRKPLSQHLLETFQSKLTSSWPSIMQRKTAFAFWGHEYNVHGTCFKSWSGWDFLTFADRVSRDNNITKILDTNGIKISRVTIYSKSDIENAIQTKIGNGLNIYLNCRKINQIYYLREVTVCIKKKNNNQYLNNYEFESCPESLNTNRINCGGNNPEGKDIMLPPST